MDRDCHWIPNCVGMTGSMRAIVKPGVLPHGPYGVNHNESSRAPSSPGQERNEVRGVPIEKWHDASALLH